MEKIIVAETFYSIQGEGVTMGIPSVFLRLAGCNLLCKGIGWTCDSIEVWKKGTATEFDKVLREDFIDRLKNGAHLVITGGEPLLQIRQLEKYVVYLSAKVPYLKIEVETNGTVIPSDLLKGFVHQWNVSPKLSSSGTIYKDRYNEEALMHFNELNTQFKFVISSEEDILEVLTDYPQCIEKAVFMPSGENRELLNKSRLLVAEYCIKLGIKYSDRLHIVIWDKKTGV